MDMAMTARDVMKTKILTVSPDVPLTNLDKLFIENRVTGFPVVESERLVGGVSRSDIVRKIASEQSYAEYVSSSSRTKRATKLRHAPTPSERRRFERRIAGEAHL